MTPTEHSQEHDLQHHEQQSGQPQTQEPQSEQPQSAQDQADSRKRSVFVGNLGTDVTAEDIREIFAEHGKVQTILQGKGGT